MSKILDPESLLNISDIGDDCDGADIGDDGDNADDILEPEDNISSQFKLMHFLNASMQNRQIYMSPMENMLPEYNDNNSNSDIKELVESIADTSNLIYDETCSITINTEQIKDTIDDLKNKFQSFQIDIENLKTSVDEILVNLRNKINV